MRSYHNLLRGFLAAGLGGMLAGGPLTGFAQTQFRIETLTPDNVTAIEANGVVSDDRSGIAVSTSKAFLTGDNGTGAWNRGDLTNGFNVGSRYDSIVMDLHTETVYTLADSGGNPIPNGGGTVAQLVELNPDTGALTGNVIPLSQSFSLNSGNSQAGIFSGYDRIVLVDGNSNINAGINPDGGNGALPVYNIELPSGTVTEIGTITAQEYFSRQSSENWATWGVAEFFDGDVSLAYVTSQSFNLATAPQGSNSRVDRINVSTNAVETVADFAPQDISDSACFTVVPSLGRWYFHYEGGSSNSIGGGRDETFGFADATFTILDEIELLNISTRASVGTGDNVAIAGFIIRNDAPNPAGAISGDGHVIPDGNQLPPPTASKRLLIRGLGPSLAQPDGAGVTGTLPDPVLELYNGNGSLIAFNNNWRDTQQSAIEDTGLPPDDNLESALVVTLASESNYTAVLRGNNNTTGVGLVEVYDLQGSSLARLVNISTRAFVSTGDNVLIGGLIVSEGTDTPPRVLIRAIGPSLTSAGVGGALQDPTLEVVDGQGNSATLVNDNWNDSPDRQEIEDSGLAPSEEAESAVIFSPAPGGTYTAIVRGVDGTTGVGLVEVYRLPPPPAP